MMVNDLDLIEKQLKYNFYKSIEDLSNKRIEKCKFKVGDKVSVRWKSRDYGYEDAECYIYYIGNKINGYKGYNFHFNQIKKSNGLMSCRGVDIPKYSKILNITKI
jgi:hypothetical protein